MLAEGWEVAPDLRSYTVKRRRGVKFQSGEAFDANAVKFSFDRAAGEKSTNKDKRTFANLTAQVVDDHTVVILNKEIDPDLLFVLGQATSIIVDPKSADSNATKPIGTGPYKLGNWSKGASITLDAWPQYRNPGSIRIRRATFRFISDAAAQVAALLAGDVDVFPRVSARGIDQFKTNPRYPVVISGSRAKPTVAINERRQPLHVVPVRRPLSAALARNAPLSGAAPGLGLPLAPRTVPPHHRRWMPLTPALRPTAAGPSPPRLRRSSPRPPRPSSAPAP